MKRSPNVPTGSSQPAPRSEKPAEGAGPNADHTSAEKPAQVAQIGPLEALAKVLAPRLAEKDKAALSEALSRFLKMCDGAGGKADDAVSATLHVRQDQSDAARVIFAVVQGGITQTRLEMDLHL